MVLEEATYSSSELDQQSNAIPQSDADSYDGQSTNSSFKPYIQVQGAPNPIYVAVEHLPRVNIFGNPNWERITALLQHRVHNGATVLERPLRQEEADALCQSVMTTIRIANYGPYLGGVIALVGLSRGRRTMRFPGGWSPIPAGKTTPDRFLMLRGAPAVFSWQALRFTTYMTLWTVAGNLFCLSNGITTSLVRDAKDPRLADYNKALAVAASKKKGEVLAGARDQASTTQQETFEQRQQRRRIQEMAQSSKVSRANGYDDASPTGGMFAEDAQDTGAGKFADTFRDTESSTEPRYDGMNARTPQQGYVQGPSREDDDFFGTSSQGMNSQTTPTSRSATDAVASQVSASQHTDDAPTGSAWDRLRQQAIQDGRSKK